jgi:hypothetical protein
LCTYDAPGWEGVIPDLAGKVITIATIDYGLHLCTADSWEIVLAGSVLVSGTGAAPTEIEVDVAESPLPPQLADVIGATVARLLVSGGGDLGEQLDDRQLSVRADDRYEAWQLAGPDGELLVCTPGGELAYFPPVRRDSAPSA